VQQALRMVLEPIFEADFLTCSHGFRQKHSTHTALRDVVRLYPRASWIIEGDIVGCYDNISHDGLMKAVKRRIADQEVLTLIKRFLKAGYMEEWQYHKTYSGVPQGGIISPLLSNIFLHQLDEYLINTLKANEIQTKKESNQRRNAEYRRVENQIQKLRRKLRGNPYRYERRELISSIQDAEKELKYIPLFDKDKRHKSKLGYIRYADDFIILVNGSKQEAEDYKEKVSKHLVKYGLELSEEKTKITHWSQSYTFLGYEIQGRLRERGNQISAMLRIPAESERRIREEMRKIARYHHIPELDAMLRISAMYRGWCQYYQYARSPQAIFSRLGQKVWWDYAHLLARKSRSNINKTVIRARKAGRLKVVERKGRKRNTFTFVSGKREYILDIFPPPTRSIHLVKTGDWKGDLKPVATLSWQEGRSTQTRLTALNRSDGLCERCVKNPASSVHHPARMKSKKTLLARVQSDKDQRETAPMLCDECHLEAHHGRWGS
jgi:group II intron reverse transcriptase/maturase